MNTENVNKISTEIGNGNFLVVEKYRADANFPEEFSIYIENAAGEIIQDICLARQHYKFTPECTLTSDIDVLVWGNAEDEDYTKKFVIPIIDDAGTNSMTVNNLE